MSIRTRRSVEFPKMVCEALASITETCCVTVSNHGLPTHGPVEVEVDSTGKPVELRYSGRVPLPLGGFHFHKICNDPNVTDAELELNGRTYTDLYSVARSLFAVYKPAIKKSYM